LHLPFLLSALGIADVSYAAIVQVVSMFCLLRIRGQVAIVPVFYHQFIGISFLVMIIASSTRG
jgi:hypothetical protein